MFDLMKGRALTIVGAAAALIIAGLLAWALRLDSLRAGWRDLALGITAQIAWSTHQERLSTSDAVSAVRRLGIERDSERSMRQLQTQQIRAWKAESDRLRQLAAAERKKALAAIASRDAAIQKLTKDVITPGERADCSKQIREAEEILLYLFREGV